MARGDSLCSLAIKKRSTVRQRASPSARVMRWRSMLMGYAVSAMPMAAMLAGQSGAVLSSTIPLAGLTSWVKYASEQRCMSSNTASRLGVMTGSAWRSVMRDSRRWAVRLSTNHGDNSLKTARTGDASACISFRGRAINS